MKKTPFQKKAALGLLNEVTKICTELNENPNIVITPRYRNTYFKFRCDYNLMQVTVRITGLITYQLTDMLGSTDGVQTYYTYKESDDHEAVIEKFIADFKRMYKDFLLAGTLHDFCGIKLSYEGDTDEALANYEEYIDFCCGEEK